MESKRKTRKVRKAVSGTREPQESPPQVKTAEELIRSNGDLVEGLLNSPVWKEVAAPLLHEMIATVSGRLTNGRYYHGSLTHDSGKVNLAFVAGYQKSLMDFHNSLRDFIEERDKLARSVRERETEKRLPVYNPFLEELHEEGD